MKLLFSPTDFSATANGAVEYAAALAEAAGAHLIIGHAYDVPAMFSDAPLTSIRDARAQLKALSIGKLSKCHINYSGNIPNCVWIRYP